MTQEQKRDAKISPLYANMTKLKLPPALFTCGTLDPLLDDSVMMHTKWMMSGAQCVLRIYPGEYLSFCRGTVSFSMLTQLRCTAWLYFVPTKCWD